MLENIAGCTSDVSLGLECETLLLKGRRRSGNSSQREVRDKQYQRCTKHFGQKERLGNDHHGVIATSTLYTQRKKYGRLDKPRPARCGVRNAETGTLSRHSSLIVEVNDPPRSSQFSCNRSIRADRNVNGTMSRGSTIRVPSRVVWPRVCPGGIANSRHVRCVTPRTGQETDWGLMSGRLTVIVHI